MMPSFSWGMTTMEHTLNPSKVVPAPVQQYHKNAHTAMVCGIISLVLLWWGLTMIAGLILAIIAFVKAKKNRALAKTMGIQESGQNKAGYICGMIGIIVSAVTLFLVIVWLVLMLGLDFTMDPTQEPRVLQLFESLQTKFSAL